MTLNITLEGCSSTFDLGTSKAAMRAIDNYNGYYSSQKYDQLKACFDALFCLVRENPSKAEVACEASHTLASCIIGSNENIYKKYMTAKSVVFVICSAEDAGHGNSSIKEIREIWKITYASFAQVIATQEFNQEVALEAKFQQEDFDYIAKFRESK